MTALLIFSLTSMGCSGLAGADGGTKPKRTPRLHAGGSTFVNLMMQKWIVEYQKAGKAKVNYQSVGSGAGLEYGISKTFDFGGTDMPMTTEQLKKANQIGGEVVHIPLCMGAVVVAYNLPEIEQPVRLSPDVIADIFLGKIKKWNDPKLLKLNPNLTLPDLDIVLVHRSDGSGTTFVMTDYLSKISPEWK